MTRGGTDMTFDLPSSSEVEQTVLRWTETSTDFIGLRARYHDTASALRHFGLVQWQARRFDMAVEAFLSALSLAPQDPRLWSDLGGAYEGLGDLPRAEFCLRRSTHDDPAQGRSWLALAGLLHRRGDRAGAQSAYEAAIALDGNLADAHFGLGLIAFENRHLSEAAARFLAAIENAPRHELARTCLGHVYYAVGAFAASAATFAAAAALGTPDHATRLKRARAITFQAMIEGRVAEALRDYPALLGAEAEDPDTIARDAFGLLSAIGHTAAAVAIGRMRLAGNPDDAIQRYLLDAVEGRPHAVAPVDYVESYFDGFASAFDHKLVRILHYRVPEQLTALVARHRMRCAEILDLGCGTGLAAEPLSRLGGRLVGVDLSGKMLEVARRHGAYADLRKAEAVAFLRSTSEAFDLVFAADMVIYFGDLEALFGAAAAALVTGGVFALSVETGPAADFTLLPSGRFAHAPAYIERLAHDAFDRLEDVETVIRLEANRPVDGRLYVFRRR